MRVIIVKCPSCGTRSSIYDNVNKVTCVYCHTVFDVNDGITVAAGESKIYKDNSEGVGDYIIQADKCYREGKFKEAIEYYRETSILDIDNAKAWWRLSESQVLADGYENFDYTILLNGFKKAYTILKEKSGLEQKINFIVNEYFNVIGQYRSFWRNIYDSKEKCERADIANYHESLFKAIKAYKGLAEIIYDTAVSNNLYSECLRCYDEIEAKKVYYEGKKRLKYLLTYKQSNDIDMDRKILSAKEGVSADNSVKVETKKENKFRFAERLNIGSKTNFDDSYVDLVKKISKMVIIAIAVLIAFILLVKLFEVVPKAIKGFPDVVGWAKNVWNDVRNNLGW